MERVHRTKNVINIIHQLFEKFISLDEIVE